MILVRCKTSLGASMNSEGYSDTSEMQDIVGASMNSGIQ